MTREEAIQIVSAEKAALAKVLAEHRASTDYFEWRRRCGEARDIAIANLTSAGAIVRDDWRGTVLKFDGIRCTCTGGIAGALSNWLARSEKEAGRG